jgi:hypothetical protein
MLGNPGHQRAMQLLPFAAAVVLIFAVVIAGVPPSSTLNRQ